MHFPKFLQIPTRHFRVSPALRVPSLVAAALLAAGCAGPRPIQSAAEAEAKAVALANARCMRDFGREPFRTGYFPPTRDGSRWLWGWLDPAGGQGYTAQVSFQADGTKPEVALSFGEPSHVDLEEPNAPRLDAPVSASLFEED